MTFSRYVAIGDSFTEGVGDVDPSRPNGVRGWADRVAEVMSRHDPDFGYANLAIRGRKMAPILSEQMGPALALEPDLVSLYAGANDIMRPNVDIDSLTSGLDDAVRQLRASGARVVLFTPHRTRRSTFAPVLRPRFAQLRDRTREVAARYDATLVEYWNIDEYQDERYWSEDRIHMAPPGHQRMAIAVLDALGIEHSLALEHAPDVVPGIPERIANNLRWTGAHAVPWVKRRLTGVSSGDALSPRWPELTALHI